MRGRASTVRLSPKTASVETCAPWRFPSHSLGLLVLRRVRDPQDKVDRHGKQQDDSQEGRTEPVIEARLSSHSYRLCPPMVCYESVYHGCHGDAREQERRDEGGPVAEVEHADGQRAQDDGEIEPREEGPLVGEKDLGLDASRERDALA